MVAADKLIDMPLLHRVSRDGVRFYSVSRGDYSRNYFVELKATLDFFRLEYDLLSSAAIFCAAHCAQKFKFQIITTPPDSGVGESFAGAAAKLISREAGIDFVKVFKNHEQGKRKSIFQKLKSPIGFNFHRVIRGQRVLIFDDIAQTGRTMAGAIKALQAKNNQVGGMVLWIDG